MHQETTKIKEQASKSQLYKVHKSCKNVQLTSFTIPISLLFSNEIHCEYIHKPSFSNY